MAKLVTVELHALFIGRVQGVGFRYTAKRMADRLGLRGTVKNLPDESVELVIQGDKAVLEGYVRDLENEFHIVETKKVFKEPAIVFEAFSIMR